MTGTESEADMQSSLLNVADVPKGDLLGRQERPSALRAIHLSCCSV
jgi:hypothetical protein